MGLEQLVQVYKDATPVFELNDNVNRDHYWFRYLRETENKFARVVNDMVYAYSVDDKDYPAFMLPMTFLGVHIGFIFRGVKTNKKMSFTDGYFPCYTAHRTVQEVRMDGESVQFPYICVTEGAMDAEVVSQVSPYVVACCSNLPCIDMLLSLSVVTNKLIFLPDNDETGKKMGGMFDKYVQKHTKGMRTAVIYPEYANDWSDLMKEENNDKMKSAMEALQTKLEIA